ncbi:MAG TPA: hypothetical protein DEH78_24470 [Solibacterales bacterium]|nr:hypothetical protein [Bryobacterales bacterium]
MTEVVVVGSRGGTHIGGSFERAAGRDLSVRLIDSGSAFEGPRLVRAASWRLLGRRPLHLDAFGESVVESCRRSQPAVLVATGLAPLSARRLEQLRRLGVKLVNYLTDDPWNPAHRASWFLQALPLYHHVFTTRRANLEELRQAVPGEVHYLPFGYDPSLFYQVDLEPAEAEALASDVVFAGGADQDRVPYFAALAEAGFTLALYGGYWDRYPATKRYARGMASPDLVRRAFRAARIGLCLVRRANRDGHCMRTFEVPATGTCMLAEDTDEHREIFGRDGLAVAYFRDIPEMIGKARALIAEEESRRAMAALALQIVTTGGHRYSDRLRSILATVHTETVSAGDRS